jgi:hypothetical protein
MADEKLRIVIDALNKATDDLTKVKKEIKGVDEATQKSNKSSKNFGQTWAGVLTGINSGIMIFNQASQAIQKIYDTARAGAELEYTEDRFDRLAASIGTTSDALMDDLGEATRGLYSDAELMNSAMEFMSLGLAKTHDEAVRLANVAGALNMNMNQLVLTLTNQTTMRFDAIGVSVDGFDEKVKQLEKTGMKTNDAFKEAFLQQAEEQIERVGEAVDSDIGKFMKMEAAGKNLRSEIKRISSSALLPAVEDFGDLATTLADVIENINGITDSSLFEWLWDINQAISPVYGGLDILNEVLGNIGEKSLPDMIVSLMEGNKVTSWLANSVEKAFTGMDKFRMMLGGMSAKEIVNYRDAIKKAGLDTGYYADQAEIAKAKSDEFGDDLGSLEGDIMDVSLAMKDYNQQLLFTMASEGLTAEQSFTLAESMGLVDERTMHAYDKTTEYQQLLDEGQITLEEYNTLVSNLAALLGSLEDVSVQVRLEYLEVYERTATQGYGGIGGEIVKPGQQASGGRVYADDPYLWQEYGYRGEVMVPSQDGYILSRSDAKQILASAGGNGRQASYGGPTADEIARAVRDGIMAAGVI